MSDNNSYARQAQAWAALGRGGQGLLSGVALVALRCWHREYAKRPGADPLMGEYLAAGEAQQSAGWFDAVLSQREYCSRCGTRYRIENLSICTRCNALHCYECVSRCEHGEAGQRFCRCGGELVG